MELKVVVDGHSHIVKFPDDIMTQAADYFDMMDNDMNKGYQMSQQWVSNPDTLQRCQIAADKLLTALETQNEKTSQLMAAYILSRMPNTKLVSLSQSGDMSTHDIDDQSDGGFDMSLF
ncbi:MAG: hypothetical protein DSZ29_04135 [Aquificaceae bacterium]|nr:MAG: hypothetical protein DSZ29_04135 [Aquificaceae bacterium]